MSEPLPGTAFPWLSVIGMGEDRLEALPPASRAALDEAEVVFGAPRHLALAGLEASSRARLWPVPFSVEPVLALRGRKVVVLASGDPFWYGAGGSLCTHLTPGEWRAYPAPSTFSWVAARMGWRLEETPCLGLHAAPFERLVPSLYHGGQAICLLRDGKAPEELAHWLEQRGFGLSTLHVMEALGGAHERIRITRANSFDLTDIQAPVAVALSMVGSGPHAAGLPAGFGLPDDLFAHDGRLPKAPYVPSLCPLWLRVGVKCCGTWGLVRALSVWSGVCLAAGPVPLSAILNAVHAYALMQPGLAWSIG